MKNEEVFFQGKGSWFQKLFQGDREYNNWSVRLHFDDASYGKFTALKEDTEGVMGIMNEVKQNDEGYYHDFKRPMYKDFGSGEEPLQPPIVLDANNQPWDKNTLIGNGSDITVKVELYKYIHKRSKKTGRAIRMTAVRIDNLVPYTKKDFSEDEQKMVRGMESQPKQLF